MLDLIALVMVLFVHVLPPPHQSSWLCWEDAPLLEVGPWVLRVDMVPAVQNREKRIGQ